MCGGGKDASEVSVFVELCICYCEKWQNSPEEKLPTELAEWAFFSQSRHKHISLCNSVGNLNLSLVLEKGIALNRHRLVRLFSV